MINNFKKKIHFFLSILNILVALLGHFIFVLEVLFFSDIFLLFSNYKQEEEIDKRIKQRF